MSCEENVCVLQEVHLIDNTGKNINMSRMHAQYRPFAELCIQESQSHTTSTCDFFHKFVECFWDKVAHYQGAKVTDCDTKYPIDPAEQDHLFDMSEKAFKTLKNYACAFSCVNEINEIYTENDEFNKNSLRLHSNLPIDVEKEAENCYRKHQQKNKCQRRANRAACLNRKYEKVLEASNITGYENLVDEIYD